MSTDRLDGTKNCYINAMEPTEQTRKEQRAAMKRLRDALVEMNVLSMLQRFSVPEELITKLESVERECRAAIAGHVK